MLPACAGADARQQDAYEALRTGQYEEAIEGLRRLASASDDLRAHRVLIDALMEVGRYEEAEATLLRSEAALVSARGEEAPIVRDARKRLVVLYERWGKPDAARRWQEKVAGTP